MIPPRAGLRLLMATAVVAGRGGWGGRDIPPPDRGSFLRIYENCVARRVRNGAVTGPNF